MFRETPKSSAPRVPGLLDLRAKQAVKKIAKLPKKPASKKPR